MTQDFSVTEPVPSRYHNRTFCPCGQNSYKTKLPCPRCGNIIMDNFTIKSVRWKSEAVKADLTTWRDGYFLRRKVGPNGIPEATEIKVKTDGSDEELSEV